MKPKLLTPLILAVAVTLPGLGLRLAGVSLAPPWMALSSGTAILGASFLLLWACDAAQAEISQALALAVVALVAVLPEYAVDMYFTWQAGRAPDSAYAHYAIANMTGANRLLIGVAWAAVAIICRLRFGRVVRLDKARRTEIFFLGCATLYAFVIPIKGSLAWYDGIVFLALYVGYIHVAGRHPAEAAVEEGGPAELIAALPKTPRRCATAALFLFAAGVILANAAPFCEGLIATGKALKISEFLLVQWVAPIASEAPEFTVALIFAWRGQGGAGLGSLLSSKLNQWTLLVGMIPGVFAVAHGTLADPLPMDNFQMQEILLTAAQSLLAVVMLASLRFGLTGALFLFGMFAGQLALPSIVDSFGGQLFGLTTAQVHPLFSALYLVAALAIMLHRPRAILCLPQGLRAVQADERPGAGEQPAEQPDDQEFEDPKCARCRWRRAEQKTDKDNE